MNLSIVPFGNFVKEVIFCLWELSNHGYGLEIWSKGGTSSTFRLHNTPFPNGTSLISQMGFIENLGHIVSEARHQRDYFIK